jgi:hypothetical protein
MVNFPGRNGRRRRVLNEEVLSASSSHAVLRAFADDELPRDAPRYSDAAGVEHHPQVTDFVPRRYRSIGLLALAGVATAAGLAVLHYFAPAVAVGLGVTDVSQFQITAAGSLAGWVAAVTLLVAAATCTMIYSLRRHRIDDIRGRYRIWLAAAAACLVLSANSVASAHDVLAQSLARFTGWSALRGDAVWWIVAGAVPLVWILVRALVDAFECRLAASLMVVAAFCYSLSAGSHFGFVPEINPDVESLSTGTALLAGHWLLLIAVISYARFVILDAQGLISIRQSSRQQRTSSAAKSVTSRPHREQAATSTPTILSAAGYSRRNQSATASANPSGSSQWVDGSRPEREAYDDDRDEESAGDERKLAKSERKRLRKLKTQNRAA